MRPYKIKTPTDPNGQPLRLFKFHHENNISKAIDQLSGICSGILADGIVNDAEAAYFANWIRVNAPLQPIWPLTDILHRIERIFEDGVCDDDERDELKGIMEAICGQPPPAEFEDLAQPTEAHSSSLPLCHPPPATIYFPERHFIVTGKFAYGTRQKVFEAIVSRGGIPAASNPTSETQYLVIGLFASRDWIHANYGRKIERAVELRSRGSGIEILSEEHWQRFLS